MALDTSITSIYEYKVHERKNDIADLNSQICADWDYIHELEREKAENQSFGYQLKSEIQDTLKELEKTRDEMYAEVEEFATGAITLSNWTSSGLNEEEMFMAIFEPLEAALQPLMDILPDLGMSNIPVIGNLLQIVKKISDMGRMIRRLPQQYVDAARKEAEQAKQADDKLAAMQKADRQKGMSDWEKRKDDFKNSKFGKICREIVDILKEVLDIIKLIAQNATLFAILELINVAKPILEAFQVGVSNIVTLLTNIATLVRMLALSSAQMLRYLYKLLEKKLTELWDVLYYVCSGGWNLPENLLISGAYSDIVCCSIEISGLTYEINDLDLTHSIELTDEQISAYQEKIQELATKIDNADFDDSSLETYRDAKTEAEEKTNGLLSTKTFLENKQFFNDIYSEDLKARGSQYYEEELLKLTQQDAYLIAKQEELRNKIEDKEIEAYEKKKAEEERKQKEEQERKEAEALAEAQDEELPNN